MPELPEVEALALFVSEQAGGCTVERAELGSFSALKTYNPPLESLVGQTVVGAQRRGKYLCIQAGDLWLVAHLARAGWLHWRDPVPPARPDRGKAPWRYGWGCRAGPGST